MEFILIFDVFACNLCDMNFHNVWKDILKDANCKFKKVDFTILNMVHTINKCNKFAYHSKSSEFL